MKILCLEEPAFYQLIDSVVKKLSKNEPDIWITGDEAQRMLNVKSKTTMQKIRDENLVIFSQPSKNIILYNRESILEYLEANANKF